MAVKLTQRCIEAIMRGETIEDPIVQFLNHKRISSGGSAERYRIIISDGIHFNTFAMLTTQLNYMITDGELQENSIIRLDQYVCSELACGRGMKKVLVILKLTVLVKGDTVGTKIGTPVNYEEIGATQEQTPANGPSAELPAPVRNNATVPSPMRNGYNRNMGASPQGGNIVPIEALNPYQNRWTIKARVVSKGSIRTWSNARSDGKLFSMDLADASGSIRATAFNDACDRFYDMLELNRVYLLSRCAVKPANKKFTTIPHDFELTLNPDSQVVPSTEDDNSIPQLTFNFTPLSALKDIAPDSFVDIVGVCKSATDVQTLRARSTNRELRKREITLVDNSDASFNVALWDSHAENFDASNTPVVAIKQAKITEFGGAKSASFGQSSQMQINPDIPKAHQLRGWFDSLDSNHEFNSISNRVGGDVGGKLWTLKEALMNQVGSQDKADYFNVEATVLFIQSDRAIYQACPSKDCKKKVVDNNNGTYRCEKCNEEFPNFEYRLMLNAQLCDWTGNQWVSMFQDQAETLLGATAAEIGRSREDFNDAPSYDEYFRKPLFKSYNFRLRAKMDTFNNENRLRMTVMNLRPIDYKEACKRLISEIKTLSGVSIANH